MRFLRFGPAAFVCLAVCSACSALQARDYEVSVRLLNGKTGQPIPNAMVGLSLIYEPPGPRGPATELMGPKKTSADGVATFRISDPLPKALAGGYLGGFRDLFACSNDPPPATEEVLQHGSVEKNLCDKKGKLKGKIVAKPGEMVVFGVPPSWWERLIPIK